MNDINHVVNTIDSALTVLEDGPKTISKLIVVSRDVFNLIIKNKDNFGEVIEYWYNDRFVEKDCLKFRGYIVNPSDQDIPPYAKNKLNELGLIGLAESEFAIANIGELLGDLYNIDSINCVRKFTFN